MASSSTKTFPTRCCSSVDGSFIAMATELEPLQEGLLALLTLINCVLIASKEAWGDEKWVAFSDVRGLVLTGLANHDFTLGKHGMKWSFCSCCGWSLNRFLIICHIRPHLCCGMVKPREKRGVQSMVRKIVPEVERELERVEDERRVVG